MVDRTRPPLEVLHHRTGQLLTIGRRLLAAIVLLGSIFCVISLMTLHVLKNPEETLHTQAFMMNYTEFSKTALAQAQVKQLAANHNKQNTDPNWDGMLAGAGIGATLGRGIPMIGSITGPVIGALIGYQLDSRI